ncbi:hypothetical protein M885DRAFT_619171 [Pelagophyceae sp. CCMP2097]|nr:hypothetical protein M885DRAFT_619171 [Pelagophyceae sp. CCMP2097]
MLASVEAELARVAPPTEAELLRTENAALKRVLQLQEAEMAAAGRAPAEAVLRKWREAVFESLVREASMQLTLRGFSAKAKAAAAELAARDGAALVAQHRATALAASVELHRQRADCADANAEAARRALVEARAVAEQRGAFSTQLQQVLKTARFNFETTDASALMTALSRHDEHAAQLERAAARLQALKQLFAQRDVRLRNATAALAAEKRLWRREREAAELAALKEVRADAADAADDRRTTDDAEDDRQPADGVALDGLRPEAEALMRGIFCDNDVEGRGAVPASLLRAALRSDGALEELMKHWVGSAAWSEALDKMDTFMAEHSGDVTWGEFLLLFIRQPASYIYAVVQGRRRLVRPEKHEVDDCVEAMVREQGVAVKAATYNDLEPMLRLTFRNAPENDDDPRGAASLDRLGVDALRHEARRLTRERAALLKALKATSTLSRRVRDEAALEWRHELSAQTRRADKAGKDVKELQRRLADVAAELKAAEVRATEARSAAVTHAERSENCLAAAQAAVDNEAARSREALRREIDHATQREARLERDVRTYAAERDAALAASRRLERDAKQAADAADDAQGRAASQKRGAAKLAEADVAAVKRERAALLHALRQAELRHAAAVQACPACQRARRPAADLASRIDMLQDRTHDLLDDLLDDDGDGDDGEHAPPEKDARR